LRSYLMGAFDFQSSHVKMPLVKSSVMLTDCRELISAVAICPCDIDQASATRRFMMRMPRNCIFSANLDA